MNKYFEQIHNMVWSYSRLSLYAQCKYAFYLKYILNDRETYLPEGNYYAEVGSFVHEILAKIFDKQLAIADAAKYFVDNYDDNVCYTVKKNIMDKSFETCANYFAESDFTWIDKYEILGVELETTQNIAGYKFLGFIDLLLKDKTTGDIVLMDHKSAPYPLSKRTGKVLKNSEKSFESYKKQMYLYCYAVKQLYGEFPKWIVWNHFKSGEFVKIEFDEKEYNSTIQWFIDTINQIENDEMFQENIDFFYCHTLCDFRNSCEYNESR